MRRESINLSPSPEGLRHMPLGRLLALQDRLEGNGSSSNGSSYLRGQRRKVQEELNRRKRMPADTGPIQSVYGFETLHEVFNSQKPDGMVECAIIEAHHDDLALFRLTSSLVSKGVRVKVVTVTDSAARGLKGYTPQELSTKRWQEGIAQNRLAGAAEMHRISLPDGHLSEHIDTAAQFINDTTKDADFFIAPHLFDPHKDHRGAQEATLEVAEAGRPVYSMDTLTGYDMYGKPLVPDRYFVLSRREARKGKRIYRVNESQVIDLPPFERVDMFSVLGMTTRRGREFGVPHAAVVFDPLNSTLDPLGEILDLRVA